MRHRLLNLIILLPLLFTLACAGSAFKRAVDEDSVAAYHRFLREYEDSKYAPEAKERLAFVRVRSKPSRKGFDSFRKRYPNSANIDELRPFVAEHFFNQARAGGAASAYRAFLKEFPDGAHADRARANAEYLEKRGFGGEIQALAEFAKTHPESDFAAEAERSVAAVELRGRTEFRRVGLRLEIPDTTPGADRLARVFTDRAARTYQAAGLSLIRLAENQDAAGAGVGASLVISHHERSVRTRLDGGQVSQPGILAETTVKLVPAGESEPIFEEVFSHRAYESERKDAVSILFGVGTQDYWSTFFVPIATWDTKVSLREPRDFSDPISALEISGPRAIVLFEDGSFQLFDVSDPASPLFLGGYKRHRDLARFSGVRATGQRVVVFGEDGIEVVRFEDGGAARERVLDRSTVGSVAGVESQGADLVVASNRGLMWVQPGDVAPRVLVPREILGLTRFGNRLLFTDGTSLFVSTLALLQAGRVEGELRLGRGFNPSTVHVDGSYAVVLGSHGLVRVDLSRPSQPIVRSRIETKEVGRIEDATLVAGRVFILGDRGLQVSDASGERIVDSVDVVARKHLGALGRHIVMIGEKSLQVVDTTPFIRSGAAAATP